MYVDNFIIILVILTAVVGEHDRTVEEGHEQRIMVEKIFLHERFKEYHHDIGKLTMEPKYLFKEISNFNIIIILKL